MLTVRFLQFTPLHASVLTFMCLWLILLSVIVSAAETGVTNPCARVQALIRQYERISRDSNQAGDGSRRDVSTMKAEVTDLRVTAAVGQALALADRHAALVQRMQVKCEELITARDCVAVEVLGANLIELKARRGSMLLQSVNTALVPLPVTSTTEDSAVPVDGAHSESPPLAPIPTISARTAEAGGNRDPVHRRSATGRCVLS